MFVFKLYKSFVIIFFWFKNILLKNIIFQIGQKFVQEDIVVVYVNSEVQSVLKDFDILEKMSYVIEFGVKENVIKIFESEDKQKVSLSKSNDLVVLSSDVL